MEDFEGDRVEFPEGHDDLAGRVGGVEWGWEGDEGGGDEVGEGEGYRPGGDFDGVDEEVSGGAIGGGSGGGEVCWRGEEVEEEIERKDCAEGDCLG